MFEDVVAAQEAGGYLDTYFQDQPQVQNVEEMTCLYSYFEDNYTSL
jgi:hypothetical protein